MITISEHKLNLFRQIDQMPEELLLELEQFVSGLLTKKKQESKSDLLSLEKGDNFSNQQVKAIQYLWEEGINSGSAGQLNMQEIRAKALHRYQGENEHGDVI